MKKILIIITASILTSCGQNNKSETTNTKNELPIEAIEKKVPEVNPNDLLFFFEDFIKNSLKVKVEQFTQERSFQPSDCLPLTFLPVLDNKIPQTRAESTGAKPLGKLKIDDGNYFLVVAQQDDYGPIYYGLIYNLKENRIKDSEIIAQIWGDAGDSQETYSVISLHNEIINIVKYIETCHLDLEVPNDEIMAADVECSDSTVTIEMKSKN